MLIFDTIVALATPPYKSALALIRISGPKTKEVLSHLIKKNRDEVIPNQAYFVKLYKDKKNPETKIDAAVLVFYPGPKSYTGFDSADISIHGSRIIAEELRDACCLYGARRAKQGEFSAQSYFNGKRDLLKAEGINDLINANSKEAKDISRRTLSGENTKIVEDLKNRFLESIADLEYYIENQYDESEEDYESSLKNVKERLEEDKKELSLLIEKTKKANQKYSGFTIAIAGEPNVGKSTLLNAIVGEDKAIVSPIPGTTRDVVEGEKEINGIKFSFKDTAGIRKSDDPIENLGIERSFKTIKEADLVLFASDNGFDDRKKNEDLQDVLKGKKVILVATKKDISKSEKDADISICSLKDDLTPLRNLRFDYLDLNQKEDSKFLGKREEEFLEKVKQNVKDTLTARETKDVDVICDTLRRSVSLLNELEGNNQNKTREDIYQTLFSKFCLGK